jgi:hypothetical protein
LFESVEFAAGDGGFFLLVAEVRGEQVAGGVGAGVLGEVDQIDGRATLFVEVGDVNWRARAPSDFPERVGVLRMTLLPASFGSSFGSSRAFQHLWYSTRR